MQIVNQMDLVNVVEIIQTFGVLPVLIIVIWYLYRKVESHEVKIDRLNESLIKDTQQNSKEIQAIHERTIASVNELTNAIRDLIEK